MMDLRISVIIPVYNAAAYVAQAVDSALEQPETGEVILVEDGSQDASLEVCRMLADENPRVRLYQHPNGGNRGAGPSRNLGMAKSTCSTIAFLDADDFYLPGRFSIPVQLLAQDAECDGVYEAVGIHFENESARQRWQASNMGHVRMTTLVRQVAPEELFRVLIKGGSGHIHLNGLVIRRSLLEKCGYMDEEIADTLHEDTDFILRAAAVGRLLPGRIDQPTSMRRVHESNRVSAPRAETIIFRDNMRQRMATYRWCKKQGLAEQRKLAFRRALSEQVLKNPRFSPTKKPGKAGSKFLALAGWPMAYPEVVLEGYYRLELARALWGWIKGNKSDG